MIFYLLILLIFSGGYNAYLNMTYLDGYCDNYESIES